MSPRALGSVLAVVILVLAACQPEALSSAQTARPTTALSPAASATPSMTSTPSPTASPPPTPSATPTEAPAESILGYGDEVAVTEHGAGLAVRVSPFVHTAIVAEFTRIDETSGNWTPAAPEVRLASGDAARLGLGPLCIEELCWYQIYNVDPLVGWDADHDGQPEDLGRGWVAAGDAQGPYLAFRKASLTDVIAASGRSSATPLSFNVEQNDIGIAVLWAMATDGLAPCNLVVTLRPGGQLLSESLVGAFQEGSTLTHMLEPGTYELEVSASVPDAPDAECPWAIALQETGSGFVP